MQHILSAKVWRGTHALEQKLVDELMHSDEYLNNLVKDNEMEMGRIFMVCRRQKKIKAKLNPLSGIFSKMIHGAMDQYMGTILSKDNPYFLNECLMSDPMITDSQIHSLTDS
jgi:ClpP class serine protease